MSPLLAKEMKMTALVQTLNSDSNFRYMIQRVHSFFDAFIVLLYTFFYISAAYCQDNGQIIKEVHIKGIRSIDEETVRHLMSLEKGAHLESETLRKGVKRLFWKDIFDDIMVTSEPLGTGLRITIHAVERPLINEITIIGNEHLSTNYLKKLFIFKEGQRYKEEYKDKALFELIMHYREKGFPDAVIDMSYATDDNQSISLELKINEGQPLMIREIKTSPEMKKFLSLDKGDVYDKEAVENDILKALDELKKQGHYKPRAGPPSFTHGVLEIPFDSGPVLIVNFKGNEEIDEERLLKELPFMEGADVNEYLIEEASQRITALYETRGYPYTQVAVGVEEKFDRVEMDIFIFEGKKVVISSLEIEGADSFPKENLFSVMTLKQGMPFSQTILNNDCEALKAFYQESGFIDVSIKGVVKDFSDTKDSVSISIHLNEGEQYLVKEIHFGGNTVFNEYELKQALSFQENKPYNEDFVRDGRFIIKKMYANQGYTDAGIRADTEQKEKNVIVTYSIDEGKQYKVGKIIIKGNEITKRDTIEREISFKEDDIYREREIIRTRNRIQRLGIFNEVSFTSHEVEEDVKDIIIDVKESKQGVVEFGFGYGEYEHFRVFFDIRYKNLWGENKEVGLTTDIDRLEQMYSLYYKQPYLFDKQLPFTATITGGRKKAIDDDNGDETLYKVNRFSLILGIEKDLTKNLAGNLDYEYAFVDTKQIDPDVILSKEDTGTTAIGSISPSLTYDTRNNRFDPSSGFLSTCTLELASTPLLSQNDFLKLTLSTSTYYNLIKDTVLAFSLRGGIADSFGDTETLPIVERFFLGGRTTVRGYKFNNLGPKVNDNPTGGNVFAMFNAEIRIPIKWGLGVVTFVDGGNVWQEIEDIDEDRRLRYTTGAGLRYSTPVGPLSIDYGRKLSRDKSSDESHGEVHFSIGHAF
jgi:outer membrane protein insertion porin family